MSTSAILRLFAVTILSFLMFFSLLLPLVVLPSARAQNVPDVIERVSVDEHGRQAYNNTWDANVSADGRYVAFDSRASNLVPDDTSAALDVFVAPVRWDPPR